MEKYNNDPNLTMKTHISSKVISDYIFHQDTLDLEISNGTILEGDTEILHHLNRFIPDQSMRIITTMMCCLLMYAYTFYLLTHEWIDNIALRRIFFLEACHYSTKMEQLNRIITKHDDTGQDCDDACVDETDMRKNRIHRSAFYRPSLTFPDISETPPPIGLYSIIIQLPRDSTIAIDNGTARAGSDKDDDASLSIQRQLMAVSVFLDEIIQPSPGKEGRLVSIRIEAIHFNLFVKLKTRLLFSSFFSFPSFRIIGISTHLGI